MLRGLDGSCKTPIAGLAEVTGDRLALRGMILDTRWPRGARRNAGGPAQAMPRRSAATPPRICSRAPVRTSCTRPDRDAAPRTRPEPEAEVMAGRFESPGRGDHRADAVVGRPKVRLPREGVDALVVTSANALRAIASHPDRPAMPAPALCGRRGNGEAGAPDGLREVIEGGGSAETLCLFWPRPSPRRTSVHLAGDVVAVDLATPLSRSGIALETAIVYESGARSGSAGNSWPLCDRASRWRHPNVAAHGGVSQRS